MDTFVSAPGGWELVLMAVVPGRILGLLLLLVYVVVRLASHDRRTPPVADETTSD